ncbi:hypothetical protein ACWEO2_42385 [Nocardia sp. NPDC004278]
MLPSEESEMEHVVVDDYVRELANALEVHNHDLRDEARLRLRLAVHFGAMKVADNGFAGQGIVTVSRLVDSDPARDALELLPAAYLVVILSDQVYTDSVRQRHTSLPYSAFRRVMVRNKEFDDPAYLYVPGYDVHSILLPDRATEPDAGPQRQEAASSSPSQTSAGVGRQASVETTINGNVHIPNGVIGMVWNQ